MSLGERFSRLEERERRLLGVLIAIVVAAVLLAPPLALLAVEEFNAVAEDRKMAKIHGLAHKRIAPCAWADQMYALHLFAHPQYNHFVHPEGL